MRAGGNPEIAGPAPATAGRVARLAAFTAAFLAVSYAPFAAPRPAINLFTLTVFWTFYSSTAIILCDEAAVLLNGPSLLTEVTSGGRRFLRFVAVGAASGLLLDGVAQWLGKLWIYPYWNPALYGSTFVLGFCAYWLLLAETYVLAKAALRRGRGRRERAPAPPGARELALYRAGAAAGGVLAAAGLAWGLAGYASAGGYAFDISTRFPASISFACFPATFVGVWLVLEYWQRRQGKASLLSEALAGNRAPLVAILLAGWTFGPFMESVNAAHHFWRYTHWPFEHVELFGAPAVVLLLWPLQHVVFLSLFHVLGKEEARSIWS